jgi:cytochrome c oxidase subunit III
VTERHHGRGRPDEVSLRIGMMVFLGTWTMLFVALLFAYGVVRVQAVSWPPPGEHALPLVLPGLNTLVLVASSLMLRAGMRAMAPGRSPRALLPGLLGAIALGCLFLALQFLVWSRASGSGLAPSSGIYGSVFYALTLFHAAHVASGLLALTVVAFRVSRPAAAASQLRAAGLAAMFWDFIAVVWIVMYVVIFVV